MKSLNQFQPKVYVTLVVYALQQLHWVYIKLRYHYETVWFGWEVEINPINMTYH